MNNEKCKGILGFLFGHKYVERMDEHRIPITLDASKIDANTLHAAVVLNSLNTPLNLVNYETKSTYVCDICVRCGNKLYREKEKK